MRNAPRAKGLALAVAMGVSALCGLAAAQESKEAAPETKAFSLLLNEGKRLAAKKRYYDAAVIFHKVLSEAPEQSEVSQEAEFEIAKALFNLGLYVSAFQHFDRVAELGRKHVRFRQVLPYLVKVHRMIPGERSTQFRLSTYSFDEYPPELKDEISYYVGQYHYYEGNLDKALDSFERVSPKSREFYPKALFLRAVVNVRLRKFREASKDFRKAIDYLKSQPDFTEADPLYQMTLMSLARLAYSMGHYKEAIKYYDQISDSSEYWLDSLFERAWAYYKLKQFDRALGSIQTVNAPYFEEEFYPEAHVLKAVILYRNCYFEEAIATIDPFYKEYFAVWKELKNALGTRKDPLDFYQYLAAISVRGAAYSTKVKKIFNAALSDRRIRNLFGFVVQITKEIKRLEQLERHPVARKMVEFLLPDLMSYREVVMSQAGQLARERLEAVERQLKARLAEALRVRFETLNAQKEVPPSKLRRIDSEPRIAVDYEHVLWPFDGEYWKDELGSYYYPLPSKCPTGSRR